MARQHYPYILPIATLAALIFVFSGTGLTGFASAPPQSQLTTIDTDVTVSTYEGLVIPRGSTVRVGIAGMTDSGLSVSRASEMPLSEFIELSGSSYDLSDDGALGYTGEHTYLIRLSNFDVDRALPAGSYNLSVRVLDDMNELSSEQSSFSI